MLCGAPPATPRTIECRVASQRQRIDAPMPGYLPWHGDMDARMAAGLLDLAAL